MVPKNQNLLRFTWKFPYQSIYRRWVRVWHWYFKILYLKSIFRQIGHKLKTLRDLHKNLHLINLERVECGHRTIFYSKPKFRQIGPKTKITSDLFKILFMSQYTFLSSWKCLQRIWHHYFCIIYLKYKFGRISPKIKTSLNLHEYSHTKQFEESNANTIIKRFSNSNTNLRKFSSNIQLQGDRYQNLNSSY